MTISSLFFRLLKRLRVCLASAVRLRWSAAQQRRRERRLVREQTLLCWTTLTLRLIIYRGGFKFKSFFFSTSSFNLVSLHQVTLPPPYLISETGSAHCSWSTEARVPITANRGQWRSDNWEPAHVFLPACRHYFSWLHHSGLPSCGFLSQGSKALCWLNKSRVTNNTSWM